MLYTYVYMNTYLYIYIYMYMHSYKVGERTRVSVKWKCREYFCYENLPKGYFIFTWILISLPDFIMEIIIGLFIILWMWVINLIFLIVFYFFLLNFMYLLFKLTVYFVWCFLNGVFEWTRCWWWRCESKTVFHSQKMCLAPIYFL